MSFALPTTPTIVDKYLPRKLDFETLPPYNISVPPRLPTIWQIIDKYDSFRELVKIAGLKDLFNDPQAKLTIFVPMDLTIQGTTLKSCVGSNIEEKTVLNLNFETARKIANSVVIPSILNTTMMIQSAFTRYRTRDPTNTLIIETSHCVQFEPYTFNRPPFGIMLNGRSKILYPDMLASNGIVHGLDRFPYY